MVLPDVPVEARHHVRSAEPIAYVDTNHVRWRVAERDARADAGTRGTRCLVFASANAVRRVWIYPPAWRELAPDALIALSWRR